AIGARRAHQSSDALLVGKLFDDRGNRMNPSWARKGPRRWRYYVSQAALQGRKQDAGSITRIPAAEIENRVVDALGKIEPRLGSGCRFVVDDQLEKSPTSTDRREPTCDRRAEIRALIDRVTVESTMIRIALSVHAAEEGEADTLSLPWTASSPIAGARSSRARTKKWASRAPCLMALVSSSSTPFAKPIAGSAICSPIPMRLLRRSPRGRARPSGPYG